MIKRRDKTTLTKLTNVDDKKKIQKTTIINSLTNYLSTQNYQILPTEISQPKIKVISPQLSIYYQIINKKGFKDSFIYLREADIVIIPSSQLIMTWFNSLAKIKQKKVWFLSDPKDKEQLKKNNQQIIPQKRITFELNADLVARAENFLQKQWKKDDYTYSSLSELIRTSLQAYQQGKLKLPKWREKHAPKKGINIRLSGDLVNFYHSLPQGRRINFVEGALLAYLDSV